MSERDDGEVSRGGKLGVMAEEPDEAEENKENDRVEAGGGRESRLSFSRQVAVLLADLR